MKVKFFAIMAALLMLGAFAVPASAQYEVTNDVIFVRLGYIPTYTVSFDAEDTDDAEFAGFAAQGEYNLNLNPLLIGFGLEYQRMVEDVSSDELVAQFLIPSVTAKFMTPGGFYIGAGLAGRYCIKNKSADSGMQFDKEIDLWANGVIGYFAPVSEFVYIDVQGRFGFNLTNQQWDTSDDIPYALEPASAYDIAIYVGVGFRATASGL